MLFYAELDIILTYIRDSGNVFLLGHVNSRIGRKAEALIMWTRVIVRHGVGNVNDDEMLLLSKCAEHRLLTTNTISSMNDKHKTSLVHPRSNH